MTTVGVDDINSAATSSPSMLLPPKPEEPLDSECCGTGCTPCVFDIYKKKLKRWEEDCSRIRNGEGLEPGENCCSDPIISPYEYRTYVVREIIQDCLNCKILHFKKDNDDDGKEPSSSSLVVTADQFPIKLGQHVVFKLEGKCRQYTVLDVRKDGSFGILFKIYEAGILTPLVDKLSLSSLVEMRGPFGNEFALTPNQYDCLVMFAAGTGIAPFCRIIQKILNNDEDETRLILYYACQDEDQVILVGRLKEWSRSWNFQVQYFLSKVKEPVKAKNIHYGMKVNFKRVDRPAVEELCKAWENKKTVLYMICGTKSFEKDVVNHLKFAGVEEEKIKTF